MNGKPQDMYEEEAHQVLMEEYAMQADELIDQPIDITSETQMILTSSDHGYAEWVILPVVLPNDEGHGLLVVQDAGEAQRRYILLYLDSVDSDDPFAYVHSFFMDNHENYEVRRAQ